MGYRCARCKEDVEIDEESDRVRCPYCGFRVLLKKRGEQPKEIKAR